MEKESDKKSPDTTEDKSPVVVQSTHDEPVEVDESVDKNYPVVESTESDNPNTKAESNQKPIKETNPQKAIDSNSDSKPKTSNSSGSQSRSNRSVDSQSQRKVPGWWLWLLCFAIAVFAVIGSAYVWQQGELQRQQQQNIQAELAAAIKRIDDQSNSARELQRELDRQAESTKQQQKNLQQRIQSLQLQLSSQQKRLLSLSTTDRADWLLAEAEYLMRLANQRLLMGKEIDGALDLLAAADEIMKELDDSALYPVRQALADDMAALTIAGQYDVDGIYLQLGALAKKADHLRLFKLPDFKLKKPEVQPSDDWQQRIMVGVSGALDKLSNYVSYKRRDDIYRPMLAPEYESAVRQNLHLMFEQAQMALLAGKQSLYEDSLVKTIFWLDTYYSVDESAIVNFKSTINALLKEKVEIKLPDISSSPRALKNYMQTIHQPPIPEKIPDKSTPNKSTLEAETAKEGTRE